MSRNNSEPRLPSKKGKAIHYGTLEELERKRLRTEASSLKPSCSSTTSTKKLVDLEDSRVNSQQTRVLEELERKRKARQIAVAVDDAEVRAHLRSLDEPMCLFGEGPADRRERLRQILARKGEDAIKPKNVLEEEVQDKSEGDKTWYHEGSESLRLSRLFIADFSLIRANKRLIQARQDKDVLETVKQARKNDSHNKLRNFGISCSQVDVRPISFASFSPENSFIATSSWSGLCKLWSLPDLNQVNTFRGHNTQASCIVFHPKSSQEKDSLNLASSGNDGSVLLWSLTSSDPIASLEKHSARVSRIAFHPSGRFLATACHDKSWRLFDVETKEELLYQEGHSREVFDIAFQSDGSLAASGGLDSFGRVWDLRTGRCIMFLEGHLKGILSIAFSPNGYQLVSGSEDHSVKVWNMRMRKLEYTIPAHNNLVSKVMFDKDSGSFIVSSSYDNTVKMWSHPGWTPIHTLEGHDNKIMGMDMTADASYVVTASYDRTFKLWTQDGLAFL